MRLREVGLQLGFRTDPKEGMPQGIPFFCVLSHSIISSLLSDSNQRPRDYKSRALAN